VSNIKEDLIKIATTTVQKHGFHKLTMRELGAAVNIKSSSVMYHFKNKDGLMYELTKVYNEDFFNYLDQINANTSDAKERLDKLIDIFESVLLEDKLCLCGMLASETDNLDITTKEQVKEFFRKLNSWIEENLNLLKKDKILAKVMVSSLEGSMLIDNLEEKNENLKAIRTWVKTL
jgi:TetR/AcrR family transcriptional repressor of nem operon